MPETWRALLVDDEELARVYLRELLASHPEVEVVAECADGFAAVKAVADLVPDILFLDVKMPKLDGFEVLELLDVRPAVVFVTAYDAYAVRAFEVHAVDYLLKPFGKERFEEALARAKARTGAAPDGKTLASAARDGARERLLVKDGAKVTVVPLASLDYVKAEDDYVLLAAGPARHLKAQTISSLEEELDPARFVRIHRSYLLNVDRLARLVSTETGSMEAILKDGTRLPVSRAGAARLKELLSQSRDRRLSKD
jgi:two-component system LytT family response regulator